MIRCFEDIDEDMKQSLEPAYIMFYILYASSLSSKSHKMHFFFLVFNKKIVCGIVFVDFVLGVMVKPNKA